MPTPKSVGAYPTHLYMIVENVLLSRTPTKIAMDSVKKAQALRLQVYGLKRALQKSEEHPLKHEAGKLTTTLDGATLTVTHVDNLVDNAVVTAAGG